MSAERVRGSRVSFTRLDGAGRPVYGPVVVEGEFEVVVEHADDEVVERVCLCPWVGVHRFVDGVWSVSREVLHSRDCVVGGIVDGVSLGAPLDSMPPGARSFSGWAGRTCTCVVGELTSCCGGTTNPDCTYHGFCDEDCEYRDE